MASGKLGTPASCPTGSNTTIYTVPALTVATANIRFANQAANDATVTAWITTTPSSPANSDLILKNATVPGAGFLELTGQVLGPGESLVVLPAINALTVRAAGFEGAQ